MTKIILCSLGDQAHKAGKVYMMTVKPAPDLPTLGVLAPTAALVYGYKHFCGDRRFLTFRTVSYEHYITGYRAVVMARLPHIEKWYKSLPQTDEESITLCCYCRPGVFCHRQLVYKLLLWLNRKLGLAHRVELY